MIFCVVSVILWDSGTEMTEHWKLVTDLELHLHVAFMSLESNHHCNLLTHEIVLDVWNARLGAVTFTKALLYLCLQAALYLMYFAVPQIWMQPCCTTMFSAFLVTFPWPFQNIANIYFMNTEVKFKSKHSLGPVCANIALIYLFPNVYSHRLTLWGQASVKDFAVVITVSLHSSN